MQKHLVQSEDILLPHWVRKQSIIICSSKLVVLKLLSMKSYLEQLTNLTESNNISLRKAFEWAGLSKTTYYRQLKGTELRYGTAIKIEEAIQQLKTLQSRRTENNK
tara:strand:- start:213 stop:530 length:318 start_codon:yes stop_codon:yes gene_type:complete